MLNISPAALENYMHGSKGSQQARDPYKLHKAAIRSCVRLLVHASCLPCKLPCDKNVLLTIDR